MGWYKLTGGENFQEKISKEKFRIVFLAKPVELKDPEGKNRRMTAVQMETLPSHQHWDKGCRGFLISSPREAKALTRVSGFEEQGYTGYCMRIHEKGNK